MVGDRSLPYHDGGRFIGALMMAVHLEAIMIDVVLSLHLQVC